MTIRLGSLPADTDLVSLGLHELGVPWRGDGEAAAEVTAGFGSFVALAGGPSVAVTVPANAVVLATWALEGSAGPNASQSTGAVMGLFRDGVDLGVGDTASLGIGQGYPTWVTVTESGLVVIDRPPAGTYTYSMRYKAPSSASEPARFRNRRLWVRTMEFQP